MVVEFTAGLDQAHRLIRRGQGAWRSGPFGPLVPVTFLKLGKSKDQALTPISLLSRILPIYPDGLDQEADLDPDLKAGWRCN